MSVMFVSFYQSSRRVVALYAVLIVTHSLAQTETSKPHANFLPNLHPASQWIATTWAELPNSYEDNPHEVVGSWLASCVRPQAAWRLVCNELSTLKNADAEVLRIWMQTRLQPYRVVPLITTDESRPALHEGLLTGYYEPIFKAKRTADERYRHPLYSLPPALAKSKNLVWLTRADIDHHTGRGDLPTQAIAYLDNAMDVLALQIQGSGQLDLGDGGLIRLAYAGTNNQPYKSVGAWLRDTHGVRELSWPSIRAWAMRNPEHLNALLWSNPRVVFFKEEVVPTKSTDLAPIGPRGAAGIPLSAGRSIAVDPQSIPYGTPVWLASSGDSLSVARLVIAQDTGAAIKGAVRADYFVGSGVAAGEIAGRLKQPLKLWVLWPK